MLRESKTRLMSSHTFLTSSTRNKVSSGSNSFSTNSVSNLSTSTELIFLFHHDLPVLLPERSWMSSDDSPDILSPSRSALEKSFIISCASERLLSLRWSHSLA